MQEIQIRCRGVITHEGKILFVKHTGREFYNPPGGHLDYGEDPRECIARELLEELGVEGVVGRLLYVHTFTNTEGKQTVEFIFEITNGSEFLITEEKEKTHAHEIADVVWLTPNDVSFVIRPECIREFFYGGTLVHTDDVRFLKP
jgi:ADP-ribose pyrophosphatase YjhB (NUDIX family)